MIEFTHPPLEADPTSIGASVHDVIQAHPEIQAGRAIAFVWTINDILELEGPHGRYPLSEGDAIEILGQVDRYYDASIGVDWDAVEQATRDFLRDKGIDPDAPDLEAE